MMRLFGYTLEEVTSQGPNGPLKSFCIENEDVWIEVGEDESGSCY